MSHRHVQDVVMYCGDIRRDPGAGLLNYRCGAAVRDGVGTDSLISAGDVVLERGATVI